MTTGLASRTEKGQKRGANSQDDNHLVGFAGFAEHIDDIQKHISQIVNSFLFGFSISYTEQSDLAVENPLVISWHKQSRYTDSRYLDHNIRFKDFSAEISANEHLTIKRSTAQSKIYLSRMAGSSLM